MSSDVRVVKCPVTYDMPDIGTSGAVLYTPTVGDILLDAWVEIDTPWDGTDPLGDIGTFVDLTPGGEVGWFNYMGGMIDMTRPDHDLSGDAADGLFVGHAVRSLQALASVFAVTQTVRAALSGVAAGYLSIQYEPSPNSEDVLPEMWAGMPGKFTSINPVKLVVNQDGVRNPPGIESGSTQGAGAVYFHVATPAIPGPGLKPGVLSPGASASGQLRIHSA